MLKKELSWELVTPKGSMKKAIIHLNNLTKSNYESNLESTDKNWKNYLSILENQSPSIEECKWINELLKSQTKSYLSHTDRKVFSTKYVSERFFKELKSSNNSKNLNSKENQTKIFIDKYIRFMGGNSSWSFKYKKAKELNQSSPRLRELLAHIGYDKDYDLTLLPFKSLTNGKYIGNHSNSYTNIWKGRYYDNLSTVSNDYIVSLKENNQDIHDYDLKNAHIVSLYLQYRHPLLRKFIEEDPYTKIANHFGISRDNAKLVLLATINGGIKLYNSKRAILGYSKYKDLPENIKERYNERYYRAQTINDFSLNKDLIKKMNEYCNWDVIKLIRSYILDIKKNIHISACGENIKDMKFSSKLSAFYCGWECIMMLEVYKQIDKQVLIHKHDGFIVDGNLDIESITDHLSSTFDAPIKFVEKEIMLKEKECPEMILPKEIRVRPPIDYSLPKIREPLSNESFLDEFLIKFTVADINNKVSN